MRKLNFENKCVTRPIATPRHELSARLPRQFSERKKKPPQVMYALNTVIIVFSKNLLFRRKTQMSSLNTDKRVHRRYSALLNFDIYGELGLSTWV